MYSGHCMQMTESKLSISVFFIGQRWCFSAALTSTQTIQNTLTPFLFQKVQSFNEENRHPNYSVSLLSTSVLWMRPFIPQMWDRPETAHTRTTTTPTATDGTRTYARRACVMMVPSVVRQSSAQNSRAKGSRSAQESAAHCVKVSRSNILSFEMQTLVAIFNLAAPFLPTWTNKKTANIGAVYM